MRRWLVGMATAAFLLAGCAAGPGGTGTAGGEASGPAGSTAPGSADLTTPVSGGNRTPADGDPNAAGRASAAATASGSAGPTADSGAGGGAAGGGTAMCANETLGESLSRAVTGGASVVLATGGFTGVTQLADGEIGVPYSEVGLTAAQTLAGPAVPAQISAWVYGDLAGGGDVVTTGEASSLWARGGAMIAIIEPPDPWTGLPGPVVRVAPVVGDDVIISWVGCWTTNGVRAREFDGTAEIFDDQGLHPVEIELSAVSLDDFRAVLPR